MDGIERKNTNKAVKNTKSNNSGSQFSSAEASAAKITTSPERRARRARSVRSSHFGASARVTARAKARSIKQSGALAKAERENVFPYVMLLVAVVVDFLEFVSFGFLGIITTPIFFATFGLWLISKGSIIRKRIWKYVKWRLFGSAVAESLPLVGAAPFKSYMVWTVHKYEGK